MEYQLVNENRCNHGYITHKYRKYKEFCNKRQRELKNTDAAVIYRLESNHAKAQITDCHKYYHKNIRILAKTKETPFLKTYRLYTELYIAQRSGNVSLDRLLELREAVADYYALMEDVYAIAGGRYDFEQYKVKFKWYDVALLFETENQLSNFVNGNLDANDRRFNTQLALKIMKYEESHKELASRLKSGDFDIFRIFNSSKKMHESVGNLSGFLKDNFVYSEHVQELLAGVTAVHLFIKSIIDRYKGDINEGPGDFAVPLMFAEFSECFSKLRNASVVKTETLKKLLVQALNDDFDLKNDNRRLPFGPITYDIAYDYIQYPKE